MNWFQTASADYPLRDVFTGMKYGKLIVGFQTACANYPRCNSPGAKEKALQIAFQTACANYLLRDPAWKEFDRSEEFRFQTASANYLLCNFAKNRGFKWLTHVSNRLRELPHA